MFNYSTFTAAMVRQIRAQEDTLRLMNETCRSQFFLQPTPSRKVCLFFHGFTAVPYQFVPLAEAFFKAGYSVLIPLLPGHGRSGYWNAAHPPPLPETAQIYEQFGLYWLQQAQALGNQVIVGGLSGGGTLAAWLALTHPRQVERTLLFAPYLSNSNKVVDLFVRLFNGYFEWKTKPGRAHFGYDGFLMPALEVFLNLGRDVLLQAQKRFMVPMLMVSSESDRAVGNRDHQALFETGLRFQPKSWYCYFDRALDIPHTMMTKAEGNNYQNLLITIAKAYLESDLTWDEVEEIGYRLRQGTTFNAVVSELNLGQRVSPDLSAIITMMLNGSLS